jgi:hypothetical protein
MFFNFIPSKKISDVAAGSKAVIKGRVVIDKEVALPGTHISCAAFWMLKEEWKRPLRGKGRKMWTPVDVTQGCPGFYIEDESGKIWVEHNDNALDLRTGRDEMGQLGKKETSRFTARVIKNGDVVKIRGTATAPKAREPEGSLVLRPDSKGSITIILKKKVKNK